MDLLNTVNKTSVVGSETFIYTINATFSAALKTEIKLFMPNKIKYELPPISGKLKDIEIINTSDGDTLIFSYGTVSDEDTTEFNIITHFDIGRIQNDSFTCLSVLYLDDIEVISKNAETVNLTLNENYILYKYVPDVTEFFPADNIKYVLSLRNYGDFGIKIENISITDILPPELKFDTTFIPVGKDVSQKIKDTHLDGQEGTISEDTLTFRMDNYYGDRYDIEFRVIIDENLNPGDEIINSANWSVDYNDRLAAQSLIKIYEDVVFAALTLTSASTVNNGHLLLNEIKFDNQSTVNVEDYEVIYSMPLELNLNHIKFSFDKNSSDNCTILIKTNLRNEFFLIINNAFGELDLNNLSDYLNENEYLTDLKIKIYNYKKSNYNGLLKILTSVKDDVVDDFVISTSVDAISSKGNYHNQIHKTISIEKKSSLNLVLLIENSKNSYYPTEILNILIKSTCVNSYFLNPVYSTLLPKELKYIFGNNYYKFYDRFENIYYDSRDDNFPFPYPDIECLENYNDTGFTLLRFKFHDTLIYSLNQLEIYFDLTVSVGATNSFKFYSQMGDPSNNAITTTSNIILDENDYDGDLAVEEYLEQKNVREYNVLYTNNFNLENLVKGNGDYDFTKAGLTTIDGKVNYKLKIINNQNAELENFEIINILPSVNDTEVITTNARGSQFNVNLRDLVTTKIVNLLSGESQDISNIKYSYSTSINPIRKNNKGEIIGSGEWLNEAPEDLNTIRSFKINSPLMFRLKPYETLIVTLNCNTNGDAKLNQIAYNSFSIEADVISDDPTLKFNLTEPLKTSLKIINPLYGSLSGYAFEDINKNGIMDKDDPGINEVVVELYDEKINFLKSTKTDNMAINDGYFIFNKLLSDTYYLKFVRPNDYIFTKKILFTHYGSKVNPDTGFTDKIILDPYENANKFFAGFIKLDEPIIYAENKKVALYGVFDPLEGVTAIDSTGYDITDKITITENNVNTNKIGIYNVSYSVIDEYGKVANLSIVVEVIHVISRKEAISDLIDSVALEETALAFILDMESLKIKKAIDLELSEEELLSINNSVSDLIRSLEKLETILDSKLRLFSGCNCKK